MSPHTVKQNKGVMWGTHPRLSTPNLIYYPASLLKTITLEVNITLQHMNFR